MEPLTVETLVDAPREEVFDFVADLANAPSYLDHFVRDFRLQRLEPTGVGAGARFKTNAPLDVLARWVELVIDDLDRPHRIQLRGRTGRLGRVPCAAAWELSDPAGGLTEVSLTIRTQPTKLADRLREGPGSRWLARHRIEQALRRLRDVVEAGGAGISPVATAGGPRLPTPVA